MEELYYAVMPEVFGYGLHAYGESIDEVIKLIKDEYLRAYKKRNNGDAEILDECNEPSSFEQRFEHYGGFVTKVKLGECYWEGSIGDYVSNLEDFFRSDEYGAGISYSDWDAGEVVQ